MLARTDEGTGYPNKNISEEINCQACAQGTSPIQPSPHENLGNKIYGVKHSVKWDAKAYSIEAMMIHDAQPKHDRNTSSGALQKLSMISYWVPVCLLQETISSLFMPWDMIASIVMTVAEKRPNNHRADYGASATTPPSGERQSPVHSTFQSNPRGGSPPASTPGPTKENGDGGGDRDGDEDRPRVKREKLSRDLSKLRFACPYYKRNPAKYRTERTCTGPGWDNIPRLKYVTIAHSL